MKTSQVLPKTSLLSTVHFKACILFQDYYVLFIACVAAHYEWKSEVSLQELALSFHYGGPPAWYQEL